MEPNREFHYCKHCKADFFIQLGALFSGDVFLVCPFCGWKHYRHFSNGEAIHCDINNRHNDPIVVHGKTSWYG